MKSTTVFFKDLTKKERSHLKTTAGVTTLTAFKATAQYQAECRAAGGIEPCYACKNIARKLGLL
jgi:hypothetical protein